MSNVPIPTALTIAGSDSGGGAGIQADIKSMQANGVYAMSVLTAITAQNTHAVDAAFDLPVDLIAQQIDTVVSDIPVGATKTGMLSSVAIIECVAERLRAHTLAPLVVDPVMISKSGFALLKPEAIETMKARMLPLATLLTPNAHEAAHLTGREVTTIEQAREAAKALGDMGPDAVLVKGGHLDGTDEAVDVLWDRGAISTIRSAFIDTPHTHGTGCTYASAIAANLAKGYDLESAIERAKRYLTEAIRHGLALGKGHGPTHHTYYLKGTGTFPVEDLRA